MTVLIEAAIVDIIDSYEEPDGSMVLTFRLDATAMDVLVKIGLQTVLEREVSRVQREQGPVEVPS